MKAYCVYKGCTTDNNREGGENVAFAERFESIVKDRGISQAELSRRLGMPYATFRYKAKHLTSWKVNEWLKLSTILNLSHQDVLFLTEEVT